MDRKIVIYDYSPSARELVKNLKFSTDSLIVVARTREEYEAAHEDGLELFFADLSDDKNLRDIGIGDDVTDFFCVTDDDDLNLFITLSARAIDKNLNILAKASDANSKKKLMLAGASETIDFNEIGANRIFHLLKRETALSLLDSIVFGTDFCGQKPGILITEIEVRKDSKLDGKTFADVDRTKYDIIVLGIQDKQISKKFIFNINLYNHKIDVGDVLVVIGNKENIERFKIECAEEGNG